MDFIDRLVFREEEIQKRVRDLGKEITSDYAALYGEGAEVRMVSVLKGGFIFLADLIRCVQLDVTVDFMAITSYGEAAASSGAVRIEQDLSMSIEDRFVLVVEDIIDTGLTLHYILRNLRSRNPRDLRVCTLLDREVRRIAPIDISYRGFEVGEEFLVGYGLDYRQKGRNLRNIYTVKTAG